MSSINNGIPETKVPAAVPETGTHHHSAIMGKIENVLHSAYLTFRTVLRICIITPKSWPKIGVLKKLHITRDKPLHTKSQEEHQERAGVVGEQQEPGTTHPEAK